VWAAVSLHSLGVHAFEKLHFTVSYLVCLCTALWYLPYIIWHGPIVGYSNLSAVCTQSGNFILQLRSNQETRSCNSGMTCCDGRR
jgi:hypothetical protein